MKKQTFSFAWIPRILSILAILFISLFALDSFAPELTFWQQLAAFAMHMIPSLVLVALLIVAWKYELAGGLLYILIGLALTPFIYTHNFRMNQSVWISLQVVLMINLPFVLAGGLFLISYFKRRKFNQLQKQQEAANPG